MSDAETPIYARSDTMLGVCHGLGQELGIHANWFRIAIALGLFVSPTGTIATYLVMGVLLVAFRWAFPFDARRVTPVGPAAAPLRGDNDDAPTADRAAA